MPHFKNLRPPAIGLTQFGPQVQRAGHFQFGLMDYLDAKDRLGMWKCPVDKAPRNGIKK